MASAASSAERIAMKTPTRKDRVDETGRIANGQVTVTNHGDNTIREVRGRVYWGDTLRQR